MILVTPHFKLAEFACKDGTPYPEEWIETKLQPLAEMLEKIREKAGHPITIVCGYRSHEYNDRLRKRGLQGERKATGVATDSRHTHGDAADIACYGMKTDELHLLILDMWLDHDLSELGGLGLYVWNGFVHVDLHKAADGHLRRWTG